MGGMEGGRGAGDGGGRWRWRSWCVCWSIEQRMGEIEGNVESGDGNGVSGVGGSGVRSDGA